MNNLVKVIISKAFFIFEYLVIYKADKTKYLRSKGMRIGNNCDIYNKVGDYGSEPYLISIGENVTITSGVTCITHDGSTRLFRGRIGDLNSKYGNKFGTIQIEDNSFIGYNSIILPNVKIGPNSIVGAGSVVTKNVPPNTVAAGNPAKYICSLDMYIKKNTGNIIQIDATDRASLEKELVTKLWKESK